MSLSDAHRCVSIGLFGIHSVDWMILSTAFQNIVWDADEACSGWLPLLLAALWIDVTLAVFHFAGSVPSLRDSLIMVVSRSDGWTISSIKYFLRFL